MQTAIDYLDVDGRRIAYRFRRGSGPVLVFLPGYASDMEGTKALALDAYAAVVGGTREFAHSMHGTQPGDPLKAAAAIERALAAEKTPLRLQLGGDSVDAVRAHATALLAELDAWESVGRGTDFDAEPQ